VGEKCFPAPAKMCWSGVCTEEMTPTTLRSIVEIQHQGSNLYKSNDKLSMRTECLLQ